MDTRVTIKGQIVIPVELRRKYGLEPGTKIRFIESEEGILLQPVTEQAVHKLQGILKEKGGLRVLLEERRRDREKENHG